MTLAYLPALAALAGSAVGGLTLLAAAWLTQNRQDRANRLSCAKATRQKLYEQFIEEASKPYGDAFVHDEVAVLALFSVYAMISQMRILSSSALVEEAEAVVPMTVSTYFAPSKMLPVLRTLISGHAIDPQGTFSEECCAEFRHLNVL